MRIIESIPQIDGAHRYRVQIGKQVVRVDVNRFHHMLSDIEGPRGRNWVAACHRAMRAIGEHIKAHRRGSPDWP